MGRLAVAAAGCGNSSPSSAESSFRELDEVFLQTQTRIWLGEVLNSRLNEDLHISDLLQDGEILFEVSKVVWNLLLTKCMELRHVKHKYGPFGSRKSIGRYMPYSNVDSFLKICKILGLSGIDLFSPSDVVEKRDIRKVCICIRALSKKARSKQLNVPDFDLVIYSVAMPTDMVGGIRRSLELSQCTLSSSSSYTSRKGSQMIPQQIKPYIPSGIDDDSDSEDEAESRYMGYMNENSISPTSNSDRCPDLGISSNSYSNPVTNGVSCLNNQTGHSCGNGVVEISDTSFSLNNDSSVVGENNYISNYLAFSDLMVHATEGNSSVVLDGETNMFDFFLHADTHGRSLDKGSLHNESKRRYSDDEEMEVSSTTSMSSVLCRMLNLEFDDQFDPDESSTTNVYSSGSVELESENCYKNPDALHETERCEMSETRSTRSSTDLFDSQEVESEMGSTPLSVSDKYVSPDSAEAESCGKFVEDGERSNEQEENIDDQYAHIIPVVSDETNIDISTSQENRTKAMLENPLVFPAEDMNGAQQDYLVGSSIQNDLISSAIEDECKDKRKQDLKVVDESILDGEKDARPGVHFAKHIRRPLLKTVVKGTAIAGVLFLLLHIRKNRGNDGREVRQTKGGGSKYTKSMFSLKNQQKGSSRGKGVYPAGKIKL